MSGQWPPEWEDSDTGLPDEWTDSGARLDPEASEVTLFLASVPSPVLPASFEARISAAIAAEATARANGAASARACWRGLCWRALLAPLAQLVAASLALDASRHWHWVGWRWARWHRVGWHWVG